MLHGVRSSGGDGDRMVVGLGLCVGAQMADKASQCWEASLSVHLAQWSVGRGMTRTSGRGSLAVAFLACLCCSAT